MHCDGRRSGVSSSNKRERDLARQKFERQQQRRDEQEAARRRRNQVVAVVAALVVVVGGVGALWLSSRSGSDVTASPGSSSTPSSSVSASPSASVEGCTTAPKPTTKTQTWARPAGPVLKAGTTYSLTLETNCGKIVVDLVADAATKVPKTGSSMLFLADQDFYTDSDCFRLTTSGIFVLQCGSPTNNGQGGPGYQLPDENLPPTGSNNYPAGTVAMANAGAGTAGSQFFIVYKDTTLPSSYTIWGKVVSGLDVVTKVAAAGVTAGAADGAPVQPIVITKATTSETPQAG
jgi:peptidyl-prolyl cis-trans isomerase B (cyclophilin B)